MKTNKIIYWIATVLTAGMNTMSAIMMIFNPDMAKGIAHLGFPDYFRIQLGIFKLIGVAILLIPKLPIKLRLVAYIGFAITFVSAFIAHTAVDGVLTAILPLVSLVLLVVSYIYLEKITE